MNIATRRNRVLLIIVSFTSVARNKTDDQTTAIHVYLKVAVLIEMSAFSPRTDESVNVFTREIAPITPQ